MKSDKLTEQLLSSIILLRRVVSQCSTETSDEKATTMLQFSALSLLKDQPDVTIGDLAKVLQLSKSSATQLIERLVKIRLVKKIADKKDRRVTRLVVTLNGEKKLALLKKKIVVKMSRFISKIPEKDIKELIRIQTDLTETIKKSGI